MGFFKHKTSKSVAHKYVLTILFAFAILAIIYFQRQSFAVSISHIRNANTRYVLLASLCTTYAFLASALSYKILASKHIRYHESLIAQIAANFINRILPAGIGGLGASIQFLRHKKHTPAQATAVVAINNGLGIVGNMIIVLTVLIFNNTTVSAIHLNSITLLGILSLIISISIIVVMNAKIRHIIELSFSSFWHNIMAFKYRKKSLYAALMVQISLTLATVGAFYFCLHAVGVSIDFALASIVFTAGFALGSAVPTPAGIGGVEAGLLSGLLAYNVPSTTGLAGVLLFRSINYWLPLLVSTPMFWYASSHNYFKKS